jgi:HEAT repeat protein
MPLVRRPAAPPPGSAPDAAVVRGALTVGTSDERWAAARAAGDDPGSAKALGEALANETDARVREAMFTSLARIATAESVESLLALLRSDDAPLRTGALDALRSMKGAVEGYLPSLLADSDPDVRLLACEIVRGLPGAEPARLLCELLGAESDPNVCAAAVEVLAEIGGRDALPVLERAAERFRTTPFLAFSIKAAADRIRSESDRSRA